MIEVKMTFATLAEMQAFFAAPVVTSDAAPVEAPKRTRKPKADAPADAPVEQTDRSGTQAAAVDAAALFGGAPVEQKIEAPKATQKDLIAAFRAWCEAKGTKPVEAYVAQFGVKSVALIPEAKWGEAVAHAQAATK